MTTIAFDGRYLAADGRMTRSDIIISANVQKLHLTEGTLNGVHQEFIVFGAGSWDGIYAIMRWMQVNDAFDRDPELARPIFPDQEAGDHHQDVSFITKEGQLYCLDGQSRPAPYEAPYAEGSGFPFAQMGLTMGMSAVEAVRAAIVMDTNSGGQITCFDIEQWRFLTPEEVTGM